MSQLAHLQNIMQRDLNILLRFLVAMILASVIGWEREQVGKSAGVRTHMLVGLGSVIFVVLGELFIVRYGALHPNIHFDPIRIIEAIVSGISFLGAGTIFVSRGEGQVHGLTTAASIWTTASVGIMVAIERYVLAIGATALIFAVLYALRFLDKRNTQRQDAKNERVSQ